MFSLISNCGGEGCTWAPRKLSGNSRGLFSRSFFAVRWFQIRLVKMTSLVGFKVHPFPLVAEFGHIFKKLFVVGFRESVA